MIWTSSALTTANGPGGERGQNEVPPVFKQTVGALAYRTHVTVDSYNFEVVKDFVYLGTSINTDNNVSLEIQRRISLANKCYFGLSRQLSSKVLSRRTKLTLYKALIMPVLTYGAEAWTMTTSDEATLGVFERKILRKIFGPLHVGNGEYRRRWNDELYERPT